jgi:hypothetical protein
MSYARVLHIEDAVDLEGNVIPAHDEIVSTQDPPDLLEPTDVTAEGRWWDLRHHDWTLAEWEGEIIGPHGWLPIVHTDRPPDTATDTADYSLELVDGQPTEVWTVRPWTQAELDAQMQAIYGSPDAIMAGLLTSYSSTQDPATAPPWAQPTGAHDGYLPGTIVNHAAATWRNDLTVMNVWEPGTQGAGWTDLTPPPSGPQPWVQPTGSSDAYNVGDQVTHNGSTWESTAAANVWEPGVYGWLTI